MTHFTVYNLRVNYRKTSLGIDDYHPRLSWQISSDTRGFAQSAYQVQVAYDAGFVSAIVWDSGKVESDRNTHI
ncbi:glycoside hydrolase family 78 protein [Cohnella herbarum]|uniref:glycoside hydrolase family 78 protein n=1 Tax=Cohnella herbarum TaxID=2728023 RepID=UPI004046D144